MLYGRIKPIKNNPDQPLWIHTGTYYIVAGDVEVQGIHLINTNGSLAAYELTSWEDIMVKMVDIKMNLK